MEVPMPVNRQRFWAPDDYGNTVRIRVRRTDTGEMFESTTNHYSGSTLGSGWEVGLGPTSYIDDWVCAPGERRVVNPVYHNRHLSAAIGNRRTIRFVDANTPDAEVEEYGARVRYYPSAPAWDADWAQMCIDLSKKLNGSHSEGLLLGVTFAELRKTIAMIRNPFGLLKADWRKIVRNLSASSLSKKAANCWLEGQYGWKATYRDIKVAAKTYESWDKRLQLDPWELLYDRYSISTKEEYGCGQWVYPLGRSEADWTGKRDNYTGSYPYYLGRGGDVRIRILRNTAKYNVGCHQNLDVAERWDRTRAALNALGLDLSSMVDTLWELVPFSFVVDWFVDPLGLWHLPGAINRLHRQDVEMPSYSMKFERAYTAQSYFNWPLYFGPVTGSLGQQSPWTYKTIEQFLPGGHMTSTEGRSVLYRRYSGFPDLSALLSSLAGFGLSTLQGISGASLAIQRALR